MTSSPAWLAGAAKPPFRPGDCVRRLAHHGCSASELFAVKLTSVSVFISGMGTDDGHGRNAASAGVVGHD
jgi:hypothetical protein